MVSALLVATLTAPHAYAAKGAIDNITRVSAGCKHGGALETDSTSGKSGPCLTDNKAVYWWLEGSIDRTTSTSDTIIEKSINDTMKRSYDGTDLSTAYDSTPVFSGTAETDIIYRSEPRDFNDPDENLIGYMWCDSRTGGLTRCDQAYINFLYANRDQYFSGRAVACHETGHAVGLLHGKDAYTRNISNTDERLGCMVTPIDGDLKYLDDSNVANINDVY